MERFVKNIFPKKKLFSDLLQYTGVRVLPETSKEERGTTVVTRQEFEQFVSRDGKDILRFCRMTTGETAQGDDLYQDTMLKLWEQAEKLDNRDSVKSYALSVAILIWKNKRRKFAWRHRIAAFESYEKHVESGGVECVRKTSDEPEQRLLQKETDEVVRQKVQELPDKYRIIIYLYYSADLKIREIAKCLHITEGAVKSRLRKAKIMLKKDLEVIRYEG